MSQVSHLKSTGLTNLDAIPRVANSPGQGGPNFLFSVDGWTTALAADSAGTTYQLARVPSNAIMKRLRFESEAQGAGAVELGAYYSTSTTDGTAANNQNSDGTPKVAGSGNEAFFAAHFSIASAVAGEYIRGNGNTTLNTINLSQEPLWQALGLASDPGGYLDIVATVNTTAITTGTGRVYAQVDYTI
jgi:hypothetical protein